MKEHMQNSNNIIVNMDGMSFFIDPNSKHSSKIANEKTWEPLTTSIIKSLVLPDDVFLDIGANFGYFSVLLSNRVNRIHAVEPDNFNFDLLSKNLKYNNVTNATAYNVAASNKNGTSSFYRHHNSRMKHSLIRVVKNMSRGLIKVSKMDDLIDEKIDVIKMDVEGGEWIAAQGMKRILSDSSIFLFEFSTKYLSKSNGIKGLRNIAGKYKYVYAIVDRLNSIEKISFKDLNSNRYRRTSYSKENIVCSNRILDTCLLTKK